MSQANNLVKEAGFLIRWQKSRWSNSGSTRKKAWPGRASQNPADLVPKSVSAFITLYHEAETYIRPFNSRSKSRAKERDAANVPKLLQTNNPNIKPFAQEQEKGRNGSTGQTSGDWGEMKHGRVNTECLNSLILDDDRGFHYHNAIADN